jgi:transposase
LSLGPQPPFVFPGETQRVAHAAFPKGSLCLRIADELADLYRDDQFPKLFPTRGQPAASPARLAWVSVLQYLDGLSDRQAADAVCGRIDWKYPARSALAAPHAADRSSSVTSRRDILVERRPCDADRLANLVNREIGAGLPTLRPRRRPD